MVQYKNVHDSNILLMYKGMLNFDLTTSIIETAEEHIGELEEDRILNKKFYKILTESVQNLFYHVEKTEITDESISPYEANSVLILISARKRFYSIITCNNIENSNVRKLKEKIDQINSMNQEEVKTAYRVALSNDIFSSKNTAGLGLLDIVRKTKTRINYSFESKGNSHSYFSMEVRLGRK